MGPKLEKETAGKGRGCSLDDVLDVMDYDKVYDLVIVDVLNKHIEGLQELSPDFSRVAEFPVEKEFRGAVSWCAEPEIAAETLFD